MNEVSGITPVGSGSNSPSQEKIALLQAQMQHYAESANASIKATADYKALQYAIRNEQYFGCSSRHRPFAPREPSCRSDQFRPGA